MSSFIALCKYFGRSDAKTEYSVKCSDIISPVLACKYTPNLLASKAFTPCANSPAIIPAKTSPVPDLASAEFPQRFLYIVKSLLQITV